MENNYQERVGSWMHTCFTQPVVNNMTERNHRFAEEAVELVQSLGCTKEHMLMLVDYVYNRPIGEPKQEVGGVMVTLAALCNVAGINLQEAAETELNRIWGKIEVIRQKQATKPKHSPLPGY